LEERFFDPITGRIEMDKFKASFRFYEQGAPYPGMCLRCGAGSRLWDLGRNIPGTNMGAYYCDGCLVELASFTGMASKDVHEGTVSKLTTELEIANAQLQVAPTLVKELTHNVQSLLSNFIVNLASGTSASKPVQPEGIEADSGDSDASVEEPRESVKGSAKSAKPSAKSAGK
jgi:hypothetical protein